MKILAIETSCDETSIALVDTDGRTLTIHGHTILSQIDVHREYGGVFPSLAKREHAKNLVPILLNILAKVPDELPENAPALPSNLETLLEREPALLESIREHVDELKNPGVDVIAVTHGPGLEPALWTGINFAKTLGTTWGIPIVPTNHMEGHIASTLLSGTEEDLSSGEFVLHNLSFPLVALLVSGGHTELVLMRKWGDYEILGSTRDDAVGEAFDKVARILDLPYPGGPEISKLAQEARDQDIKPPFSLSRPMINSGDLNFSFSGIKTGVRNKTAELGENLTNEQKQGIAREFEEAVIDVLIDKTNKALEQSSASVLCIAGGVAANPYLATKTFELMEGFDIRFAPRPLTSDNALMIALAGYERMVYASDQLIVQPSTENVSAVGNLSVAHPYQIDKDEL